MNRIFCPLLFLKICYNKGVKEANGRVAVLDPSYKPGKFEEEGRVGKVEMRCEVVALAEVSTIVDDTADRTPHYHLFKRK